MCDKKILEFGTNEICLFCGNEMKVEWEDRESYFVCSCDDYKKNERINNEIAELKRTLPVKKYEIEKVYVLSKKD